MPFLNSGAKLGRWILVAGGLICAARAATPPVDVGSRRLLFLDDALLAHRSHAELRLHPPQPRETVLTFDAPWEGSGSDFERLIREGDELRMYYMGTELTTTEGQLRHAQTVACLAISRDGIHWTKPDLGLCDFHGTRHNNIVWTEPKLDNFTPFRDTNPSCAPDAKYKAMSSGGAGHLFALKSPDGIHWTRLVEGTVMTRGQFDSQNDAFWDPSRRTYFCYIRGFHDAAGAPVADSRHGTAGIRDIRVATSADFIHWSEPQRLDFGAAPDEALYTNQIEPYYRAPEVLVGFPTRYVERNFSAAALEALPDPAHRRLRMSFSPRYGQAVTDGLFMFSRDGYHFHRWDESFIPPGPQRSNNWVYGDGYQSLGLIETPAADPTADPELSCYVDEGHWKDGETLRRYVLRLDGFVSLHASRALGEMLTRLVRFSGHHLELNFATSAAGSLRVGLVDERGQPIPGFGREDCDELFGDSVHRIVTWHGRSDLGGLIGRPVALSVTLTEADLYALRFAP